MQRSSLSIRLADWPQRERPRERLLEGGAGVLSDGELLALVLRVSTAGRGNLLSLCHQLLTRFGGLAALARCEAGELLEVPGVGPARACALVAALELGRRLPARRGIDGSPLGCSAEVYAHLAPQLLDLRQERFLVLALDARHRPLRIWPVARGSATSVEVHPREVLGPLIRHGAVATVVAHNHPSGDVLPSADDRSLTNRLKAACDLVGIPLLDHLIVAGSDYLSFADQGLL
ncbi:MAG: DNA repair protein RadC [Deltaproteobacteria bacterium]|nr:DNA repair protein RadC [Deltaproteobacteria bacterium]